MLGGAGSAGSFGRGGTAGTAGSGGTAGTIGSAGTGGVDAGPPTGTECTNNAMLECRLHGDCCTCTGLTTFEPDPPPGCSASCSMNECQRTGITGPQCLLGQCIAGLDCTTLLVACPDPRPTCPAGLVASRVGSCWGPCVNPTDCSKVQDCTACRPGQLCVAYAEAGTFARYRCLNVPSRCAGNPRCNCLRSYACPNGYTSCADTATGVTCNCPNC
jgi:hypothetical protein